MPNYTLSEVMGGYGGSGVSSGEIKSIQRGNTSVNGIGVSNSAPIATVDPSKSTISVFGATYGGGASCAYLNNFTSNTITFTSYSNQTSVLSWEVVEYI